MFRRSLVIAVLLLPGAAMAQSETRLHLSESGSVSLAPDEMVASLRIEARARNAGQAQEQVNCAMAAALAAVRAATAPSVTTEDITPTARVTADLLLSR